MGDSPSVGYLLQGTPDNPSQPGWGGQFARVWDGRKTIFDRLTTEADRVEVFGVGGVRVAGSGGDGARAIGQGAVRRACAAWTRQRRRHAAVPLLAARRQGVAVSYRRGIGLEGQVAAVPPCRGSARGRASALHPNWWIDDPDPAAAKASIPGAKSMQPMAGGVPARLRGAHAARAGPGSGACTAADRGADGYRERAGRRGVDGAVPGVLESVGGGGVGGHHVRAPEG